MLRRLSSCFFWGVLLAAVLCAAWGLSPRWRLERADRTVAILADFREVLPLARAAGLTPEEGLSRLKERGIGGLMVSELTGEDAVHGIGWASLETVKQRTATE